MENITIGILTGWAILSIICGVLGDSRSIGSTFGFFAALVLSPVIGLIIVLASKRNADVEYDLLVLNELRKLNGKEPILREEPQENWYKR